MNLDPISEKGNGVLFLIEQRHRSLSRGMDLLILNTLSKIWKSLGRLKRRQGRIDGGCGGVTKTEQKFSLT